MQGDFGGGGVLMLNIKINRTSFKLRDNQKVKE